MIIIYKIKNAKAICWLNDNELLYFKRGGFFVCDLKSKKNTYICKIPLTKKLSLLSNFYLFRRLFRIYPQSPIFIQKTRTIYFSLYGYIYSLELNSKSIKREIQLNHNASRVLSFCSFLDDSVYFGEYPTKSDGEQPICIYKKEKNEWLIKYRFDAKEVRHIHFLLSSRNDLFCFTGDEDQETKIVLFKNRDFNNPFLIASNDQTFRSCFADFDNRALFYLTDTPYLDNKLFKYDIEKKKRECLKELEGTVIYGLKDDRTLYFSTCVEYNLRKNRNNKNVRMKIDGKSGGIKSKYSFIYSYNLDSNNLTKLYSLKKDFLPIYPFGIGTFVFTSNTSNKYLAATSSSLACDETVFIFLK